MRTTTLSQSRLLKDWGAAQDTGTYWAVEWWHGTHGEPETVSQREIDSDEDRGARSWIVDCAAYSLEELIVWLEGEGYRVWLVPKDGPEERQFETVWLATDATHTQRLEKRPLTRCSPWQRRCTVRGRSD